MPHPHDAVPTTAAPRAPEPGAYWVEQMEAGLAFLERVVAHPVEDDGEPLVDVAERARLAGVELECAQRPHVAERPRLFLVREGIVEPLLAAAAELRAIDHTLLLEDAFRTREMQRDLAVADEVLEQLVRTLLSAEPDASVETMAQRLAVVVVARPKGAGHMAGAAVDVTVLGPDGSPLDRGGPYLTVSEKMPMASPFVAEEAARNRRFISDVMLRHGFAAYPFEFWHYSRDDAFDRVAMGDERPARYGAVDLLPNGGVIPVADQLALLHDDADLRQRLAAVASEPIRSAADDGAEARPDRA